jgi:hypothetical protein
MAYTNGGFGFGMKQPEPEWSPPAAAPPEDPPAFGERDVPGVPEGAEPPLAPEEPVVTVMDSTGAQAEPVEDTRVRIIVPYKYLKKLTKAKGVLGPYGLGGIIFPYTPSISFDVKADYASQNPLHSNFAINFYQKSSIGSISISGKFSVQNNEDAEVYMATMRLLKALTRMRSGGQQYFGDEDSGAPPPICRLSAHGDAMLKNVPVAITSYRIELPDSVDYFTSKTLNGTNSIPTVSTIAITCLPMYSRNEMQQFSVTGYLANRHKGII